MWPSVSTSGHTSTVLYEYILILMCSTEQPGLWMEALAHFAKLEQSASGVKPSLDRVLTRAL